MSLNFPFRVYIYLMITSGFHRKVDEICVPLGYYAAHSNKLLRTFRDNLSLPFPRFKKFKKKLHIT